jgi:hypothetical protein
MFAAAVAVPFEAIIAITVRVVPDSDRFQLSTDDVVSLAFPVAVHTEVAGTVTVVEHDVPARMEQVPVVSQGHPEVEVQALWAVLTIDDAMTLLNVAAIGEAGTIAVIPDPLAAAV